MNEPTRQGWGALLQEEAWVELALALAARAGLLVATLVLGWACSRVAGRVVTRLFDRAGLEVAMERAGASRLLYRVGIRGGAARQAGRLVQLIGLGITAYLALAQLGIEALTRVMGRLLAYAPSVLAAGLILLGGALASERLRGLILPPEAREEAGLTRRFLAQMAYGVGMVLTVMLSLEQLGVELALIQDLILAVYGVATLSLAVMFALGAREAMHQLLAGHYVRKLLRQGDVLTLADGRTGEVLRVGALHVVLAEGESRERLVPHGDVLQQGGQLTYTEHSAPKT